MVIFSLLNIPALRTRNLSPGYAIQYKGLCPDIFTVSEPGKVEALVRDKKSWKRSSRKEGDTRH